MRALAVTLIFLAVLLFSPSQAHGWVYWTVRALAFAWALWLQRQIFNHRP